MPFPISIGSYPLVPPFIYRRTASLSFPVHYDSSWRSTAPNSPRLRTIREILSIVQTENHFHRDSNRSECSWMAEIDWARRLERNYFIISHDLDDYNKRVTRWLEAYQKNYGSFLMRRFAGKIRVRSLTELAYMKMWEGASEQVKEKASVPSDDPVRLFLRELFYKEEQETASKLSANIMKL